MINLHICFIFFAAVISFDHCQKVLPQADLRPPVFSPQDSIYNGVFLPWDGIWEGQFIIYTDPQGQKRTSPNKSIVIDSNRIKKLEVMQIIEVRQSYRSLSSYYQEVNILDTYIKDNDTVQVQSHGINKVENGKLWCVVEKPDEKIVHQGILQQPNTLIWYRHDEDPLRKEYFVEEIRDNTYSIMGYGYYGKDKLDLEPRTWFYGQYHYLSDYFR